MGACYDVSSLPHQATDRSLCNRMSTWYRQNRARCMHGKISPTPFDNVTATLAKVWRLYSVARSLSKRRYNWSFRKVRAFGVCFRFSLVFFVFKSLSTFIAQALFWVNILCIIFVVFFEFFTQLCFIFPVIYLVLLFVLRCFLYNSMNWFLILFA